MPLSPQALEQPAQATDLQVDARWTMAYAAGVPDASPELYATDRENGPAVHPLFPVAAEWQLITSMRAANTGLSPDEARRGIHVAHDLVLHRPLHTNGAAGTSVRLSARTVAVSHQRAGATQTVEFVAAVDDEPLWRTRMTSLYLGVALDGTPATTDDPWPAAPNEYTANPSDAYEPAVETSWVRPVDAHVYSECARIWNPIHTDVVAARRSGLEAPILHGTATLARSVSIVARLAQVELSAITRVGASFSGQVLLGSSFDVRLLGTDHHTIHFDALLPNGRTALRSAWCSTAAITQW